MEEGDGWRDNGPDRGSAELAGDDSQLLQNPHMLSHWNGTVTLSVVTDWAVFLLVGLGCRHHFHEGVFPPSLPPERLTVWEVRSRGSRGGDVTLDQDFAEGTRATPSHVCQAGHAPATELR
jgi:hypothetical protein